MPPSPIGPIGGTSMTRQGLVSLVLIACRSAQRYHCRIGHSDYGNRAAAACAIEQVMSELKLIAFDAEDLAVVSAHLQDAVLKVGDLAYLPGEKRFAALSNRFDWLAALPGDEQSPVQARRQCALRFERVLKAQVTDIDLRKKDDVLAVLAVQFTPGDLPAGVVTIVFAGRGAIRLEVECIEAELKDLGAAWEARGMPQHSGDRESEKLP